MLKSAIYSARATTTGGRSGQSRTDDGRLSVMLDMPREMGGDDGPGTNPEQLFAAGYSACFLSGLKLIARQEKIQLPENAAINVRVDFGERANGKGYSLAAALEVVLPGIARETAQELMEKAHQICPYSNATRGNIDVELRVADAELSVV